MFAFMKGQKEVEVRESSFSAFIRGASSREKKRVYSRVLGKAIERQNSVLAKHEQSKA